MATLPPYARVQLAGYSEEFDPSIHRTEMERGPAKQAIANTHVEMKLRCSLLFQSKADVAAFEDWYFTDLKRIGYFTMRHPRTRATISARFENASIGTLMPAAGGFGIAQRDVVIEYLR